jgi:hypothetical protein
LFHVTHLLFTELVNGRLNGILSLAEILVLAYSGSKVVGEVVVDDVVDGVGEGCLGVEKTLLVDGDCRTDVVNAGSGEGTCVDGVSFSVGAGHFGL